MNEPNIPLWLEQGVRLHQANRLAEAKQFYGKVLAADARNPDALNLMGLIAAHTGRHDEALTLFDRAVAAAPYFVEAHFNKGIALTSLGRNLEAIHAFTHTLQLDPTHAGASLNLGNIYHQTGRIEDAIGAFRAAIRNAPNDWRGLYNLGSCLLETLTQAHGDERRIPCEEAVAALMRARDLQPDSADVLFALGRSLAMRGDYASATDAVRLSLQKVSHWSTGKRAEVLSTLGEYLRKEQQHDDAIISHREAIALDSRNHLFQFNLAVTLAGAGKDAEAESLYKKVIAAQPDYASAYINLGNIYRDRNQFGEAISILEKASQLAPSSQIYTNIGATMSDLGWMSTSLMLQDKSMSLGSPSDTTRYNRALTLLSLGRFETGWAEHEARFGVPQIQTVRRAPPEWRGEELSGKRLLIWMEQGIGDQILHASMISELVTRAAHVLIECVARLAPILARSLPGTTVIGRTTPTSSPADSERYDFQIAAGSIGQYLRTSFGSFPVRNKYLCADSDKVARFRKRYLDLAQGRRIVGIAWKSLNHRIGANKSATLVDFAPLLKTEGTFFVSLQYGNCANEVAEIRDRFGVDVFQDSDVDQLTDMDTFFAQVAAMDLVVTTSNTTVHVAGSQGIPTRLLLPHGKGVIWYWFQHRLDSPWYPSVRIERARRDQEWPAAPLKRVAAELRADEAQPGNGPV